MASLQEQILDLCLNYQVEFRNTYSGRGMYGRQCIGIVGHRREINEALAALIKGMNSAICRAARNSDTDEEMVETVDNMQDEFDRNIDRLFQFQEDSMGLDIIVYWADLQPIEGYDENSGEFGDGDHD